MFFTNKLISKHTKPPLSTMETTYTYRGGKKVPLLKSDDQLVVRLLPQDLPSLGIPTGEQVSSSSTKVAVLPGQLDATMATFRTVAPTHHAYYEESSGKEFLLTDRIM